VTTDCSRRPVRFANQLPRVVATMTEGQSGTIVRGNRSAVLDPEHGRWRNVRSAGVSAYLSVAQLGRVGEFDGPGPRCRSVCEKNVNRGG